MDRSVGEGMRAVRSSCEKRNERRKEEEKGEGEGEGSEKGRREEQVELDFFLESELKERRNDERTKSS